MISLFMLVFASFAATNIDNLLLLVSFLVAEGRRATLVFAGFMLGMLVVLGISVTLGQLAMVIPLALIGYMGLIPMLLGLYMLIGNFRRKGDGVAGDVAATGDQPAWSLIAGIAATQLANGVDTVLVFAPLLADSSAAFDVPVALVFLMVASVWFMMARVFTLHATRLPAVSEAGRWLAPLVMIVVGLYILDNTATDNLPGMR